VGAQNGQIWMATDLIGIKSDVAHNGGSARGYQELSALLAIPTTAERVGVPGRMVMHRQRLA
jgi:hypothetical protein